MTKAVIFDSDGTLVNTTDLIVEGFKETLRNFGFVNYADNKTILDAIGGHIPDVFAKITNLNANSDTVKGMTLELDAVQDKIALNTIEAYPNERETLQKINYCIYNKPSSI